MSWEIIKFRPRNHALSNPVGEATTTNTANVVAIMNHGWVIDPNRIPEDDTYARDFFETLSRTRVLYIVQKWEWEIEPTDIIYTLSSPDKDEVSIYQQSW